MPDLEHANSLLRMAHKDFNALVGMQENSLFADEIFGFHVQQAVEKTLKIWLCICGAGSYPNISREDVLAALGFVSELFKEKAFVAAGK